MRYPPHHMICDTMWVLPLRAKCVLSNLANISKTSSVLNSFIALFCLFFPFFSLFSRLCLEISKVKINKMRNLWEKTEKKYFKLFQDHFQDWWRFPDEYSTKNLLTNYHTRNQKNGLRYCLCIAISEGLTEPFLPLMCCCKWW